MGNPHYEFYTFKDLLEAGIVGSRFTLHQKIRDEGFPMPLKERDSKQARAFWRKSTVHAWLDQRHPERKERLQDGKRGTHGEQQTTQ